MHTSHSYRAARRARHSRQERGYILLAFSLSLFFLLGVAGLAVDIGRMYVAKSEVQSFVDAAALNAAVRLSITPGAFTDAATVAAQTPKNWEFGTRPFTSVETKFGTGPFDTFIANPPAAGHTASEYTFAQVTARVNLPLYLLGVLVRSSVSSIGASAVAGLELTNGLPGGVFPFSPYSRANYSPEAPVGTGEGQDPFGYRAGNLYTLRWGAKGGGDFSTCGTDQASGAYKQKRSSRFRGYCCTGTHNVPDVERAILSGEGLTDVYTGQPMNELEVPGQKNAIDDIGAYINRWDPDDTTSATYAEYVANNRGNGKRVVTVAVNGIVNGHWQVVGFAAFFLLPPSNYDKGPASKTSWCAEYIGPAVPRMPGLGPPLGGTGGGVYHLRLYQ